MITRYIEIPYLTVPNGVDKVSRGIVLNLYRARGRCQLERWSQSDNQRTIAALESIAPNLPDTCFATTANARYFFVASTMHYLARNGSSSNYHRLQEWPVPVLPHGHPNRENTQQIVARFTTANIAGLSETFNTITRTILGLPIVNEEISADLVTQSMAEACACFLEALSKTPSPSALALSTEIYCLAYFSIAKQGNITDAKLTAIYNAVTEETGRTISLTIRRYVRGYKEGCQLSPYVCASRCSRQ